MSEMDGSAGGKPPRANEPPTETPVTQRRWRTAAFDHAEEAIIVVDREGWFVDANTAACELSGFSRGDLLSIRIGNDPETHAYGESIWRRLGTAKRFSMRHDFLRADGTKVPTELSAVADYVPGLHLLVFRDLRTQLRAQARLRVLSRALEQSSDLVLITDAKGVIEYVNAAWERITGYTAKEAIGQTPTLVRSGQHDDEFYREMWETISAGRPFTAEFVNQAKNGEVYFEEKTITPLKDEKGDITHYVSSGRNLDQRREFESRLRQVQRLEAVGQLAGGIAHDFNNLLTVIQANVTLALGELGPGHPVTEDLDDTLRAAKRAATLTRQLLAFGRKQVLEPVVLDLNHVLQDLQRNLLRLLGAHVELVLELEPSLHRVKVDRGQMEQVIVNMAVNARDAMPDGGTLSIATSNEELDAQCAERLRLKPGPHVRMTVKDDGVGMDAGTLARIFEPFFTTKARGHGTGLGLSTVYGIVSQSGGAIRAESQRGVGSTFGIYLPVTRDSQQLRKIEALTPPKSLSGQTILVVEDEPTVLRSARRVLSRLGYRVLEASDARAALDLAERLRESIHLVLTDVVLPKMNGRELAERLRAMQPTIKVLFMSGYTGDVLAERNSLPSNMPFLQKPFTPDALARKVQSVLRGDDG